MKKFLFVYFLLLSGLCYIIEPAFEGWLPEIGCLFFFILAMFLFGRACIDQLDAWNHEAWMNYGD